MQRLTKFSAKKLLLLCLVLASVIVRSVYAQGISIIGASSLAANCYHASGAAARTNSSSRQDLEDCNNAISFGALKSNDMVATLVNRGIIKVALKDFKGGQADYQKALKLQPEAAEAYLNRGNLLFMAKRYDEAITDYKTSLEFGIKLPAVAELNIGLCEELKGNNRVAKQQYEKALLINPDWLMATEKLARVTKKIAKQK